MASIKQWAGLRLELALAAGLTGLSIWLHATIDYLGGPAETRLPVFAVFLATLAYAGWTLWRTPANRIGIWSPWSPAAVAAVAAAGCVIFWIGIDRQPSWSEEAYWLELARNALNSGQYHPIWFKGDFPSSFQSWPITGLLAIGVPPLLASRIPILFYMVGAGLMTAATTRFFVPKPSIALGVVFSFASLWMVFIVHVGWSDVGPIPLMIAAMTYFLAASVLEPSPRNHTCLAVAAAVGFATLYMPMIYALIMLAIFAVLPTRIAGLGEKLRFAAVFSVLVSSTIGKAIQWPNDAVSRHVAIVEKGKEWAEGSSGTLARVVEIGHNLREIVKMMLPDNEPVAWWNLLPGRVEPSTFAFFVVGLATMWIGLNWLRRGLLILPPLLLIAGVAIADPRPSPWRLTVLAPILFLYASIGAGRIVQLVSRRGGPNLRFAAIGVIIGLQVVAFLLPWLTFMENRYDSNRVSDIAATIATEYESELATLDVVSEGGIFSRMIQNMSASKIRYRRYYSPSDLRTAISESGADRFLVITVTDDYGVDRYYEIGLRTIQTLGLNFRRESVVGPLAPRSVATVFIVNVEPAENREVRPDIEVPIDSPSGVEDRDPQLKRGIEEALRLIQEKDTVTVP